MRAGAAHDFGTVINQAVQFGCKRLNLGGETSDKAMRLAVADARERCAHAVERLQANAHLYEDREDEPDAQNRKRPDKRAVELRYFGLDFGDVAGDEEEITPRRALRHIRRRWKFYALRDDAQVLRVRPFDMSPDRIMRLCGVGNPERRIKQRARNLRVIDIRAFGA